MNKVLQSFMLLLCTLLLPAVIHAQQSSIYCDVNSDGAVNITDINSVVNMILEGTHEGRGDVNGDGTISISDINAIINIILCGELPITDGHEYVDLGLPSGTLWATCNVGANSPEEYGDYFAWGEIEPKDYYSWSNYKWCAGTENSLTKYCTEIVNGTIDGKRVLELEDDAACMNWGPAWRIPTYSQLRELGRMSKWEQTSINGVKGFLLTGPNGNSLFLPAAGEYRDDWLDQGFSASYWSGTMETGGSTGVYYLYTTDASFDNYISYITWRAMGCPVRAVRIHAANERNLYIQQQQLDMGAAYTGDRCTGKLTILNETQTSKTLTVTTDAPFSLKEGDDSVTSMTVVVPGNSIASVTVAFTATTAGEFTGNVTFRNQALDGGQSVIPIRILAISRAEFEQDYVDLGLPSGTLWATRNIGAESPEQFGDYFAWGEIEPKDTYDKSTYKWYDSGTSLLTKYCCDSREGTADYKTELEPEDDAAWANWGPMWRMPTRDQMIELHNNCSSRWITLNGINGCLVTGPNGNTMFLPAAGYLSYRSTNDASVKGEYWSRSLNIPTNANGPIYSYEMTLSSTGLSCIHTFRYDGNSVRAVRASVNDIYIDEASLDLGIGLVGETRTGELTIINCTKEAITLTAMVDEPFSFKRGEESASSLTVEVPGDSCTRVTVMLTASAAGEYNGHVIFKHPALGVGQGEVPVHGLAYADPEQDYVDLGLPSGTLWAARNIGAGSPEEPGNFFAWGETAPKDEYFYHNYKWFNDTKDKLTKYCTNSEYGAVDGKTELDPEDDAAWVNLGPAWRMPSVDQLSELAEKCTWTWMTRNGINGYLVTGPNGNSMFMPRTGSFYDNDYYWSRAVSPRYNPTDAVVLDITTQWLVSSDVRRYYGCPVRAVRMSLNQVYIEQQSLDLGIASVGNTSTGELTIVNCTDEAITLTGVVDEPFSFKRDGSTASGITVNVPGKSYVRVTVLFTATTAGQFNGKVTFHSAPDGSQLEVPVSALVFPDNVQAQDAVDLGLPSGTLWAACNVGASSPEELGDAFAWGETVANARCDWSVYKWCDGSFNKLTKYCTSGSLGIADNLTELEPEDDAAWANWGPMWRMPGNEQFTELEECCSWKRVKKDGVEGRLVTGPNGNSIFIPATDDCDYWSRALNPAIPFYAYGRSVSADDAVWLVMWSPRISGCYVRAVSNASTMREN